jgi:hypothetical protein
MKYQTDYDGLIRKDGCLVCSLVSMMEQHVGVSLAPTEFLGLVQDMFRVYKVISDENDTNAFGLYVLDHEGVCKATLERLGSNEGVDYVGRVFMPQHRDKLHTDFGTSEGDFVVLQVVTRRGNGHFRLPDHDPINPPAGVKDIKSVRYYRWET